jgi:hypothetical protein
MKQEDRHHEQILSIPEARPMVLVLVRDRFLRCACGGDVALKVHGVFISDDPVSVLRTLCGKVAIFVSRLTQTRTRITCKKCKKRKK